jgi:hypothetical protein
MYFTNEIDRVLDLVVGTRLPSFHNNHRVDHIAYSRYIELQGFVGFWGHQGGWGSQVLFRSSRASYASSVLWNLSCFLRSLKKVSPLTSSHEMNLLNAAIHTVNFWTSWRIFCGLILVIANTFSKLGSM